MKNTQKGFTLVELLVVIAILAILAGVGVAGYSAFIGRAEESNATTEAHQIGSAIETALIGNDYVIVKANVYATKSGDTVVFSATQPTGTRYTDLTDDLADFASKLTIVDTDLHYTYNAEVTVDVISGEVQ